jgi:hypothetical protein
MQRQPASVVFAQHVENVRIRQGIAPASDDRQQFLVGVEPFQRGVNLVSDLCCDIGPRRSMPPAD